jgi:hypothetical protein
MSSISELASFAARLRGFIRDSTSVPAAGAPLFDRLAVELFALQFEHNAPYRRLCEARGARPETVPHWIGIPAAPTSAFKEFTLSCLPAAARTAVFHSSGTTGQRRSRHFHSKESLALYEASLWAWFRANFKLPLGHATVLMLTPPPHEAPHSSLVHMFETLRRRLGSGASCFVGRVSEAGGWAVDLEAAVAFLREAIAASQPALILGAAFSFVHLLDQLAERGLRFELPTGSCAMETGGYKGRSRSLPKAALHALISQRLGIPSGQIICEYGMSELSSQAYDAAVHPSRATRPLQQRDSPASHASRAFRFPPWARAQLISPETGREVGAGETGLIRVFDLANVYSVMAIQTEDLGIRRKDGFALAGRATLAEPRGCSLLAV